jgi:nitrogen fixation/metabolism regulation signal transduction histidine kinase
MACLPIDGPAIVKRILDLHSGSIEIRNRAAGGTHGQLMFKTRNINRN